MDNEKATIMFAAVMGCLGIGMDARADTPNAALAPYIATFQKGGKSLLYVAVTHHSSVQYPDAMKDPTFETVAVAFEQSPPQAVIVEGVDPPELASFEQFAAQCAAENFDIPGCDEPELAADRAAASGAVLFTGEPVDTSILASFVSQGYAPQDVLAFYLMRNIPAWERDETLTHDTFPEIANQALRSFQKVLGTSVSFDFDDFTRWYSAHMPVPADYLDLTVDETGPATGPGTTLLQQMSATDTAARDGNVIQTIQTALAQYDRVTVVYGASHLDFEASAIEQMMGEPVISKPF